MDHPGANKSIRVSQGSHIVLDESFFPSSEALMIPKTSDGRILFAVPWYKKVVIGTTDTPVDGSSLEPRALESEVNFILETAASYFSVKPTRKDVLSVFAGLRPLAIPKRSGQKTKEISRSHMIVVSPSKLFTILGGKWTTYRKMGEDMVNRIEKVCGWNHRKPVTATLPVHGYTNEVNRNDSFYFYGSDAKFLRQEINGGENYWLSEELSIHSSQVRWAVQHEMARTLEDVLSRRTRALLLDAKESRRIAHAVAAIMAKALNKDDNWQQEQIRSFLDVSQLYCLNV